MTTELMITECSICLLFILSVACVRLLDNRDIRASVWVFLTKSNAKIAIGWAELASIVTSQKMLNMRRFPARLKKRRFDGKCETKSTSAGIHAETHITKIKQTRRSFSAFSFYVEIVSWQGSLEETRRLMKPGLPSHKEISITKFAERYVKNRN